MTDEGLHSSSVKQSLRKYKQIKSPANSQSPWITTTIKGYSQSSQSIRLCKYFIHYCIRFVALLNTKS